MSKDVIIKFFNLLNDDYFNDPYILSDLKLKIMEYWNEGKLTDSEHCDLEAWIDYKLGRF